MQPKNEDTEFIHRLFLSHGIHHFGWASLKRPLSIELYKDWLDKNYHQDMGYLKNHLKIKENPSSNTKAHSAIVFTIPYAPTHPWPLNSISVFQTSIEWAPESPGKRKSTSIKKNGFNNSVALYAQGKDYHTELPLLLSPLLSQLKNRFPNQIFELFTDSAPILERDLAYRAGLGWIGKNTCLINSKKGSLFLIGEIYTSLELYNNNPWSSDFCGTCTQCIEACPTQALKNTSSLSPTKGSDLEDPFIRRLDPSKCISYWTIEAKSQPTPHPPESLREHFGEWLFGCDICQTVCPWNRKPINELLEKKAISTTQEKIEELRWILSSTRKNLNRSLAQTPLSRASGWKIQRNAIIIATNKKYYELIPLIKKYQDDPILSELVHWSLKKFDN